MARAEFPTLFQYDALARRRAFLLLLAALVAGVSLSVVLGLRWEDWGLSTRAVAMLLLLVALFTVRAQFARLRFRLRVTDDAVNVQAPWNNRTIPWPAIVEVRRMNMPAIGRGDRRWACAIWIEGRTERPRVLFLFDSDIENAATALDLMYMHTPHARHRGGSAPKSVG